MPTTLNGMETKGVKTMSTILDRLIDNELPDDEMEMINQLVTVSADDLWTLTQNRRWVKLADGPLGGQFVAVDASRIGSDAAVLDGHVYKLSDIPFKSADMALLEIRDSNGIVIPVRTQGHFWKTINASTNDILGRYTPAESFNVPEWGCAFHERQPKTIMR
jgi:hypothetical protein